MGKGVVVIVERNPYGAWVCSQTVRGFLVTRAFYGYTKTEAMYHFRKALKEVRHVS